MNKKTQLVLASLATTLLVAGCASGPSFVELNALTAYFGKRVYNMRFYFEESKFEDLEESHWTGANNDCIGFNGGVQFTLPVDQVCF